MPRRRAGEEQQIRGVRDLLRGTDGRLEEGRVRLFRAVTRQRLHEPVHYAAPQLALEADPLLQVGQLRVGRAVDEPVVKHADGLLVLLLLTQQLGDAEAQLRVLRLALELVDERADRFEGVALLLIQAGDVLPGRPEWPGCRSRP